MYKIFNDPSGVTSCGVIHDDKKGIPFDPANTDYQTFKVNVLAGEELQDADGNVMTQEEADNFIKELP